MFSSALESVGRQGDMFGWAKPLLYGYYSGLKDILIKITVWFDVEESKILISTSRNI